MFLESPAIHHSPLINAIFDFTHNLHIEQLFVSYNLLNHGH